MEEQVWDLYIKAKQMEESADPMMAMPNIPSTGTQDNIYMQPVPSQQQTQETDGATGYSASTSRSAFSFIQNSLM